MGSIKLKEKIYWVGVKDYELEVFDIIMKTQKGTTYNSYVINDDKIVIVDSVKDGFFEKFINNIKEVIGDKVVDYIIVQHSELDHSGSISNLLEVYPEATVIGTTATLTYLKEILNRDFNCKSITEIKELNIGKNTLKFIAAPNLHWPDTMFTYIPEQQFIFTCDVTGAHYALKNEDMVIYEIDDDYYREFKYYFDCIMGPFKKFVLSGLDKIKNLDIEMMAPSHGPIHKGKNVKECIDLYIQMAIEKVVDKNVQIFYISAYHNTENMAEYLKDKLIEKGIKAEAHEITSMPIESAVELFNKATGVLIGSPTINQDAVEPAWRLLTSISVIPNRGKISAAFGSYGWSGEAVPMLTERLKSMKFKVLDDGFKFKFVPGKNDFKLANEFIEKFTKLIK